MASQRLTIAKVGGRSAQDVAALFNAWKKVAAEDRSPSEFAVAIDAFATRLREHANYPPVLYFAEWIDLWSMGDLVPGLGDERAVIVASSRFEVACHRSPIRIQATTIAGEETQETRWLRNRIQEAQDAWSNMTQEFIVFARSSADWSLTRNLWSRLAQLRLGSLLNWPKNREEEPVLTPKSKLRPQVWIFLVLGQFRKLSSIRPNCRK